MATVSNQYDPNDPDAQNQSGGSGTVLNSTGGDDAGGGSGGSAPAAPQRSTPSGAPNINQYLQANQGAGERLSSGIQSNVQNQANQIGQGVQSTNNKLNAQYQPLQQNLGANAQQTTQQAFQNPQALLDAYNAQKTAPANSTPLSQDQQNNVNQYNQFQKLNTGGYGQDIQNYGTTAQQASNQLQQQQSALAQRAGMAANESGRNQLLQQTVGQPGYNVGQQTLDSLFLQAQPGVANQLQQNLGNIANQSGQQVSGLTSDSQQRLAALKGLSGQDQQAIKNLFNNGNASGTGLNQISSNVQNEYNNLATSAPSAQAGILASMKSNQYTPEQLNSLGLGQGQQTWGVDLSNYVANNPLNPAATGGYAQAATPEEFARYNALNQLAGGPNGLQSNMFGAATSAGGYKPYQFDTQRALQDINAKKASINADALSSLQKARPALGQYEYGQLADQISAGLQSGKMNPIEATQQINDLIASGNYYGQNGYWDGYAPQAAWAKNAFSPFTNYVQNEYSPAANSVLNVTNPESTPLPVNAGKGTFDWSQIAAPTGAAGKGDDTPLDPSLYLPGKNS